VAQVDEPREQERETEREHEREHERGLWALWQRERTPQLRERIVAFYARVVRIHAACCYRQRHSLELEFGDYLQFGRIGLLEAVDRFDPGSGFRFETFAGSRIQGAILNGVETLSEKQNQIAVRRRARSERAKSLADGRVPRDGAQSLQALADVAVGLALGFMLDRSLMYLDGEPAVEGPYEQVASRQLCQRVRQALELLPETERRVVRDHYLQQVPFEALAERLCVTKGRVSQIHRSALKRLRVLVASG
jgi:RNA polymerase sigma factor for flagellar operon FliA